MGEKTATSLLFTHDLLRAKINKKPLLRGRGWDFHRLV